MRMRAPMAAVAALAVVLAAAGAAPAAVVLHLKLDASVPEADQVVTEAPDRIVLDYSQSPELAVSRVTLEGEQGEVEVSEVKRSEEDDTILWVAIEQPLTDGAYTVNWVTSSGDGHPIRGEFSFTVSTGR